MFLFYAAKRPYSWAENNDGFCLLLELFSACQLPKCTFCCSKRVLQGSCDQLLSVWSSRLCTRKVQPRGTWAIHTSVTEYHIGCLGLFLTIFFPAVRYQFQDSERTSGKATTHTITEISVKFKWVIYCYLLSKGENCIISVIQLGLMLWLLSVHCFVIAAVQFSQPDIQDYTRLTFFLYFRLIHGELLSLCVFACVCIGIIIFR